MILIGDMLGQSDSSNLGVAMRFADSRCSQAQPMADCVVADLKLAPLQWRPSQSEIAGKKSGRAAAVVAVLIVHAVSVWCLLQRSLSKALIVPPSIALLMEPVAVSVKAPVAPFLRADLVLPSQETMSVPDVEFPREWLRDNVAAEAFDKRTDSSVPAITMSSIDTAARPVLQDSEIDYVRRPVVRYPAAAKRMTEQGTVWLSVLVSDGGLVTDVTVIQSAGFAHLDEAAMRALRLARFKPYVRNGVAVAVEVRVPVVFSLSL